MKFTEKTVSFGPRIPGSQAIIELRAYIHSQLKTLNCEIIDDSFTAQTPLGRVEMANIIARFPGESGRAVVFSGHYDTKYLPDIRFVGANDAGSSTGLLLELARVLAGRKRKHDVYLVWFDGEEAYVRYTKTDGFFGSLHLARRWEEDGTLKRIDALINIDMIGDKDLGILPESFSSKKLRKLVWQAAAKLGYSRHFLDTEGGVMDDHIAFLKRGVDVINLIDFNFGPDNSYWHTPEDTLDKLSPHSFEIVGKVLLEVLSQLELDTTP